VIFSAVLYTLFLGIALALAFDLGAVPKWLLQPNPRPAPPPL
jgi:hypothetical protein